MERHFSIGVATIVALMAAHRAASDREDTSTDCFQEELSRIDAYLNQADTPTSRPAGRSRSSQCWARHSWIRQ